jgi:3-deoxy-D-manno-octulosonate 8-phosphate phosphatase KdsC-like HAD superfamily phosphatase
MIDYDLKKIKAVIFDVDGVLSAETIGMDDEGQPCAPSTSRTAMPYSSP